jgi:YceI-like domain
LARSRLRGVQDAAVRGPWQRDAHLRSPDSLDVDSYPTIMFRGTSIEGSPERFRVVGETGGVLVGDTIKINLDVQAIRVE